MTQCNTLNVKLSNSQLNKLKSAIKNGSEVTLNLSSNLTESSNNKTNFPHKLLLTNTQVLKICKAFVNSSSANIKFSKTQLFKMIHSGGILGELLVGIPYRMLHTGKEALKKGITLVKNAAPELTKKS